MKTLTVISYDFFYQASGEPWFCSYATTVMVGDKVLHSELVQLSELADFERLREHVIEEAFEKQTEYRNPDTGTRGETYSKIFGAEQSALNILFV